MRTTLPLLISTCVSVVLAKDVGENDIVEPPLLQFEKHIIAHGVMSMTGYLILLPIGAILARWMRTFSPFWFKVHWIIQFCLATPLVIAGLVCGVVAVNKENTMALSDPHMKWGVALFILYFVQVTLGGFLHFFKPRSPAWSIRGRPLQNYLHAIIGILIIGIAFYQVRTGFRTEWPFYTGRGKVMNGANIAWIVWLVLVPVAYFSGMLLLRRQYRQEAATAASARKAESDGNSDIY